MKRIYLFIVLLLTVVVLSAQNYPSQPIKPVKNATTQIGEPMTSPTRPDIPSVIVTIVRISD